MRILFIGDISGSTGRKTASKMISEIKQKESFDFCIANCENVAGGLGLTYTLAQELRKNGIEVITLGNHTWSKKEITNFIDSVGCIVRPANYPEELPGKGSCMLSKKDMKIGVINVQGQVYMDPIDCPFKACEREIAKLRKETKVIIIDFHAEATSEKCALANYLDGRVSAVLGTHTHVQTADERILPCGTSFISDVGMTGPYDSVIGMEKEIVIKKFTTHFPERFEPAKGRGQFNAVLLDIDEATGKTINIKRIFEVCDEV